MYDLQYRDSPYEVMCVITLKEFFFSTMEFYNLNTASGSSSVSLFHWLVTLPRLAKKHQGMTFLHWHNLASDNTIIPITANAG
jgi:hypothetical protein